METAELRLEVMERAHYRCECGRSDCHRDAQELDHMFGRAKVEQSVENCWLLSTVCHEEKTRNDPSAGQWLRLFIIHAGKHGYRDALLQAANKLSWLTSKGTTR